MGNKYDPAKGETSKAGPRREREGFFDKYINGRDVIDIGCQNDPVADGVTRYDRIFGDSDAQTLPEIDDDSFDTVYASHVLEHLDDPAAALRNFYRICRPGGHVVVVVPHRDLYEKRTHLPSKWNPEHKHFFVPVDDDPPDTLGLRSLVSATLPVAEIVEFEVRDEGHTNPPPHIHPDGEYSIEIILRKPEPIGSPDVVEQPEPGGESATATADPPKPKKKRKRRKPSSPTPSDS